MNNDLISSEDLKNFINTVCFSKEEEWVKFRVDNGSRGQIERILAYIDNAPTVDTTCPNCDSVYAQGYSDGYLEGKEERPQGHWIKHISNIECSNCGEKFYCEEDENCQDYEPCNDFLFNFCPNCGADMRGDRE